MKKNNSKIKYVIYGFVYNANIIKLDMNYV